MKVQSSIALALAPLGLAVSLAACSAAPQPAEEGIATESSALTAAALRPDWAKVCDVKLQPPAFPKAFYTRRGEWTLPIVGGGGLFGGDVKIIGFRTQLSTCQAVKGTNGNWSGKPFVRKVPGTTKTEETNFCVHVWTPNAGTDATPDYNALEDDVLDELQPSKPQPTGLFQDPFYADCSGNAKTINLDSASHASAVDYVSMPDDYACLSHDKDGNCLILRPLNLMPQCPACCTVTDDQIITIIPQAPGDRGGVLDNQHAYAVIPKIGPDGKIASYASIQVAPDGAQGTAYVMTIPVADRGKLRTGTYDVGATD